MKKVKINVEMPKVKDFTGSCKWLIDEYLKCSWVEIQILRGGLPGIYLCKLYEDGEKREILLGYVDHRFSEDATEWAPNVWAVRAVSNKYFDGIFDILTDEAKDMFEDFQSDVMDLLQCFWEEDTRNYEWEIIIQ